MGLTMLLINGGHWSIWYQVKEHEHSPSSSICALDRFTFANGQRQRSVIKEYLGFRIFLCHCTLWNSFPPYYMHLICSIFINGKIVLCLLIYISIIFSLMWVCDRSRQNIFMCPDLLLFVFMWRLLFSYTVTGHLYLFNRF